MKKHKNIGYIALIIMIVLTLGCEQNLGEKIEFGNIEIYYTSNVTRNDAKRLGEFFVLLGMVSNNEGNEVTYQLNKTENTYEVRFIVLNNAENDPKYIQSCREFTYDLSQHVFNGNKVEIHLCDEYLKTISVIY